MTKKIITWESADYAVGRYPEYFKNFCDYLINKGAPPFDDDLDVALQKYECRYTCIHGFSSDTCVLTFDNEESMMQFILEWS